MFVMFLSEELKLNWKLKTTSEIFVKLSSLGIVKQTSAPGIKTK